MTRYILITLCIVLYSNSIVAQETKQKVTITFTDIELLNGELNVAIYSKSDAFPNGEYYLAQRHPIKLNTESIHFMVSPGEYAVAAFQDLNGNEKLDKKMLGKPKEPFSFSRNFKPKFSAPKFEDCSFIVGDTDLELELKLIH